MAVSKSRARLVKLIHVGKRDLRMDDDAYRAALLALTGRRSTSDMAVAELEQVLAHLKRCGFKVQPAKKAGSRPQAASEQAAKIRALWLELHKTKKVRDPAEAALARWVERETRVAALQWLDVATASRVIEKLKQWLAR